MKRRIYSILVEKNKYEGDTKNSTTEKRRAVSIEKKRRKHKETNRNKQNRTL